MKRLRITTLVFLISFWASHGYADIFTWTNQYGVTHFSNLDPPPEAKLFLRTLEVTHSELTNPKTPPKHLGDIQQSKPDDSAHHVQTAELESTRAGDREEAFLLESDVARSRTRLDTRCLPGAGYHPIRLRPKHHFYGTSYHSPDYYRFPPWRTYSRWDRYDRYRILSKGYQRPLYIQKPYRGLRHREHDLGSRDHRGNPFARFSKRAFLGAEHLKPVPTIGDHRGSHYGWGYFRR